MALINRIVEYPGRIKLTAVSGETDTYDVTRAEGTVTQEGTPLDAEHLTAAFGQVMTDYTGTVSYDAGTIGTRATAVNLGTAERAGYKLASIIIMSASNASAYNITPYVSGSTLYAGIFRATSAAVSGASITIRAIWAPEE